MMLEVLLLSILYGSVHAFYDLPPICNKTLPHCRRGQFPECGYKHPDVPDKWVSTWECVKLKDITCSNKPLPNCPRRKPFVECHILFMGATKWQCEPRTACDGLPPKCASDELIQCYTYEKKRVKEEFTGFWYCTSIADTRCNPSKFPKCPGWAPVPECRYMQGWKCDWPLGWGFQPKPYPTIGI